VHKSTGGPGRWTEGCLVEYVYELRWEVYVHKCTCENLKEMKMRVRMRVTDRRACVWFICVSVHSLGRYPTIAISSNPDSASIMTPLVTNPD